MTSDRQSVSAARLLGAIAAALLTHVPIGAPPCAAETYPTGEFELSVTTSDISGPESARAMAHIIPPLEEITWNLYVPETSRADWPAGALVFVSPSRSGRIPGGWKSVMERHNLIWIAASGAGNRTPSLRRATLALLATELLRSRYEIDPGRVYVSGFSGGGKIAGMLAAGYPELFRGAVYICGIDSPRKNPPRREDRFRANRFVFLTGSEDSALQETRSAHRQYVEGGAVNSLLMIVRDMGHELPDATDLDAAIRYLEAGDAAAGG